MEDKIKLRAEMMDKFVKRMKEKGLNFSKLFMIKAPYTTRSTCWDFLYGSPKFFVIDSLKALDSYKES